MSNTQVQIFESKDGKAQLKVSLQQNTVWLSQAQMSELFDTTPENVLMHLKNIFKVDFYNLFHLNTASFITNNDFVYNFCHLLLECLDTITCNNL